MRLYYRLGEGGVSFDEAFSPFGKLLEAGLFEFLLILVPMVVIFIGYGEVLLRAMTMDFSEGEVGGGVVGADMFLVVLGWILLLLLPLFFWAGLYFILDGKKGVWDAFGASFSLFSQHLGKVVGLLLLSVVVWFLGVLSCCVGPFVAIPVVQIAGVALYVGLTEGGLPESGGAPTQA